MCLLVAQLCLTHCDPIDCNLPGFSVQDSPAKNTGMGSHSLLQGILPTQESNPGLLHCKQVFYHLSHKGSLRGLSYLLVKTCKLSGFIESPQFAECVTCKNTKELEYRRSADKGGLHYRVETRQKISRIHKNTLKCENEYNPLCNYLGPYVTHKALEFHLPYWLRR